MEESPSWETNRSSANQEIRCILWNQKVYYRIHQSSLPTPVQKQMKIVQAPTPLLEDQF